MGRSKKIPVNNVVKTRRKKQQSSKSSESSTTPENSLDSDNTSYNSQDTGAENDSQDSSTTNRVPPLSHKKFGKYRCLLVNDNKYQLSLGNSEDDSENGSNVEVRVVDPTVSSESDSNSPAYLSKELKTFSKMESLTKPSTSTDNSLNRHSVPKMLLEGINSTTDSNSSDIDSTINLNSTMEYDTQLPDPTLNLISQCDPRHGGLMETSPASSPIPISRSCERMGDADIDEHNGDDEMVAVFEIIDENLFYDTRAEDTMFNDSVDSSDRVAIVLSTDSDNSKVAESPIDFPRYNVDAQALSDFESRLGNISITCGSSLITKRTNDAANRRHTKQIDNDSPSTSAPQENNSSSNKIESNLLNETSSSTTDSSTSTTTTTAVRRSSRIKIISDLKQKSKGRGLVKAPPKKTEVPLVKEVLVKVSDSLPESLKSSPDSYPSSPSGSSHNLGNSPSFPVPNVDIDPKPVKVKSRWRRSSELEMGSHSPVTPPLQSPTTNGGKLSTLYEHSDMLSSKQEESVSPLTTSQQCYLADTDEETQRRLKQFETICENDYHCDRTISKEARKMTCDCFLTKDEIERGELGCGEDCLNRLLMIECNSRCPVGERCTNRRFQNRQYSNLRVMRTEKKGLGLQAVSFILSGDFLMEYVGEVLNSKQFNKKAEEYSSSDKTVHHYFMALKGDAVIDATLKGNISRFINHSCDPNAETQKWTVNGELRIGFFSKRDILPGEEVTFDYQFQRYGKEAQKCYCEAGNCRGWIGEQPDSESEEEEEEEDGEPEEKKPLPDIKTEVEEGKPTVLQVKEELKTEEDAEQSQAKTSEAAVVTQQEDVKPTTKGRHKKKGKPKKFLRAAKELLEDVDLEEDMEMLSRSGIKNQSHTLSLCRAMVRAKRETARITLLRLLASADLPCRRLFLDYRGLKLIAPWCQDANASFRLSILTALEKLPIPNKTILKECNLITYLEKWLSSSSPTVKSPRDDSDNSRCGTPTLIDESTGLPITLPPRLNHKTEACFTNAESPAADSVKGKRESFYDSEGQKKDIARLCKSLLDRWSQLKEVFKIPKKERIELMKEHERQANEPHSRKDGEKETTRVRKTRWEERYSRPERPSDRDKKRSRPPSPDSCRKIKLDDSSPLSKEARRREFAERAAREEKLRKGAPSIPDSVKKGPLLPLPPNMGPPPPSWMRPPDFNMHPFGPMMMGGMPPPEFLVPPNIPQNYVPMDYMQQKPFVVPYCGPPQPMYMPPQGFPMMGPGAPFSHPPPSPAPFQNMPQPPGIIPPSLMTQQGMSIPPPYSTMPLLNPPQPAPSPSLLNLPPVVIPNLPSIPRPCTPPLPHILSSTGAPMVQKFSLTEPLSTMLMQQQFSQDVRSREFDAQNVSTPTDENQDNETDVVVPFAPVRLPPSWRSVKDVRGRTYYYHVKLRMPQWEPPLYSPTPHSKDEASSSSEEESSEDERRENGDVTMVEEEHFTREKLVEGVNGIYRVEASIVNGVKVTGAVNKVKKSRPGLVTGCWIISPRKEEDRIANQIELRRYKENKEKLRRRKEQALLAAAAQNEAIVKYRKKLKEKYSKKSAPKKKKESELVAEETARRRKEIFRTNMARVMVQHLSPFRRDDCSLGRITNNADFKHLARKLTHFVLLKELKHCKDVNELECNDSVKQKAKEFIRKYMAKFGAVYERPPEEMD